MKYWMKLSFRTQMIIVYVLSSTILVGLMALALFYSTTRIIQQEIASNTETAIEKSGRQLEMYINELTGFSELIAQNKQVCRYFGESDQSEAERLMDFSDITVMVETVLSVNPEIASIILVGSDGKLISNEKDLEMNFAGNIKDQEWYQSILSAKMPVLTSARMQEFSMDKDTWVISLGREILDENGNRIGVLRIDLHYDVIETILQDINLGKSGYAFILNKANQVVYHENPIYFTNHEKHQELLNMLLMPDTELTRGYMLLHQSQLQNADWLLVGVASLDGVFRIQRDIIVALWMAGSVLIVLSLLGSNFFANSLSKPMKKLEMAMTQVEIGELETIIPPGDNAELESLAEHFRKMMIQVRILMEEMKVKEQSLRMSEIKTLHSQINPHFLYNTLDTIIWQAELGQADSVVHLSKAMARFFRLSLHGGSELTTVRDELDHVRQYLTIQRERYGDQLVYTIDADETTLDISIPKILLQPLAENAIYHGLRQKEGNWMIDLKAKDLGHSIALIVSDNGIGFNNAVPVKREEKVRLGGIGLSNIDERIHLYYGENCELSIDSELGKGTTITITILKNIPSAV